METNPEAIIDIQKKNHSLPKDVVYLGTTGHLAAFDLSETYQPTSNIGKKIPVKWNTNLTEGSLSSYHNVAFCIHHDQPTIYSSFNGGVRAHYADTGETIWHSKPPKVNGLLRDDLGTIAVSPLNPGKIFFGSSGYVMCLDQIDGKVLWETSLKSTGFMNVALLPFNQDMVIAGSNGICFALDTKTGKSLWENNLSGTGYGDLTCAKYSINNHGTYSDDILIVGCNGYILNINPVNGETKLKTNLKNTGYHAVSILVDQQLHLLFVVTYGKAFALHPESHKQEWVNEMRGMGLASGQGVTMLGGNIIVGTYGKVMCINKKSGTSVWMDSLPGCGYEIVTALAHQERLFVATNGKFYELVPSTGKVIWRDDLTGFGYSPIYLASYAPYAYTDHNSTTIVQYIHEQRKSKNHHNH